MTVKIVMTLMSDAIFGNGISETGGADISVLVDEYGFPYYKGGTFKGVFRETLEEYLDWTIEEPDEQQKKREIQATLERLLGKPGNEIDGQQEKLIFSDFRISEKVRQAVLDELQDAPAELVTDCMTHLRTFTRLTPEGVAEPGSLRVARCVNQGLSFYATIGCSKTDEPLVKEVLPMLKWVGTLRNRGFGKVKISVLEGEG
jgi:CRISPR-associated protein Csx10